MFAMKSRFAFIGSRIILILVGHIMASFKLSQLFCYTEIALTIENFALTIADNIMCPCKKRGHFFDLSKVDTLYPLI